MMNNEQWPMDPFGGDLFWNRITNVCHIPQIRCQPKTKHKDRQRDDEMTDGRLRNNRPKDTSSICVSPQQ
jgi:hypothetical protein